MGIGGLHIWQIFFLLLYMLPGFIAWRRKHHNTMAITLVNLLIGWTVLGWIGALIWAFVDSREPRTQTDN